MTVNMETLPARMRSLKLTDKGIPIPWFVAYINGKPEFRAMDNQKFISAIKQRLCWVCGERLGVWKVFVAGPMCGVNRTSSEPPSHYECATWSAINCPFLSNPKMVRREDELINNDSMRENVGGMGITRNPGVAMLWLTREYELFKTDTGPLIQMGEPSSVDWICEGREATRAEVQASIDSGLPILEAVARTEAGGLEALHKAVKRFEKWLPA
jgi:hypothetical protein